MKILKNSYGRNDKYVKKESKRKKKNSKNYKD